MALAEWPFAMRNLLLATGLAAVAILPSACDGAAKPLPEPPVLSVTSPQRSLIQDHAGQLLVTGTVAPNPEGVPVTKVMVNDVPAIINADGSFSAPIQLTEGASLIHTVATDANGGTASDTRSVEAGELRAPGSNISNALTAAISANAFGKIGDAAGTMIAHADLMSMLAPLNPVVHSGDENGPDCLYAQAYVDNVTMTNAKISLVPVDGGLSFTAELDGLDITGHMNYAAACVNGSNNVEIKADVVSIGGTLDIQPNGMAGFTTQLVSPDVQLSGLNISASGVPGAILDILPLDSVIQFVAPKAAELFMGPLMNSALGGLAGPKQLTVLGKTIDVQVSPSAISFDSSGGTVVLDMQMLIEGTENSNGYVFTQNGMPALDPGDGLQLGLADDLANEALSELTATGLLNLSLPEQGGTFDSATLTATSPPMISADPADGKMRLVLPDMMMTFTSQGTPVAKAALNAKIDLAISPAQGGSSVAIDLGTPDISVDVLGDVQNQTQLSDDDLSKAVQLGLGGQISSISALLKGIPLPQVAGLTLTNTSVSASDGYVMVKTTVQ